MSANVVGTINTDMLLKVKRKHVILTAICIISTWIFNVGAIVTGFTGLIRVDQTLNCVCVSLMFAFNNRGYKILCHWIEVICYNTKQQTAQSNITQLVSMTNGSTMSSDVSTI